MTDTHPEATIDDESATSSDTTVRSDRPLALDGSPATTVRALANALRRPAYTGSRRCWPCTTLNLVLLAIASAFLAVLSSVGALALATVGLVSIWLRGYLVPYTPRFAPRLAARLPVSWFDEGTGVPSGWEDGGLAGMVDDDGTALGESVLAALVESGVLTSDASGERVAPTDAFVDRWLDEMRSVRDLDPDALAAAVADAAAGSVEVEVLDEVAGVEPWVGITGADGQESWFPRAIAIAEVGAARALAAEAPAVPSDLRAAAARPLRAFLETCPLCEGPVVERDPPACCGADRRSLPDSILACADCEARLYAFDV